MGGRDSAQPEIPLKGTRCRTDKALGRANGPGAARIVKKITHASPRLGYGPALHARIRVMFMKLFTMPDFAVTTFDANEAERLTRVIAADRILRRERAQWSVRSMQRRLPIVGAAHSQ
jgi:hypothetical protein